MTDCNCHKKKNPKLVVSDKDYAPSAPEHKPENVDWRADYVQTDPVTEQTGEVTRTFKPGIHWHFPPPTGEKEVIVKPEYHLLPFDILANINTAFADGEIKHGRDDWRTFRGREKEEQYFNKIMRHLNAFMAGEHIDKESGIPHLWKAAADCIILCHIGRDDGKNNMDG